MSSTIWLTDRSRYEAGLAHCLRDRFLNYHSGPTGYGIARRAQSVPLAAGISYHLGIGAVLEYCQQNDQKPPDAVVRMAAQDAVAAYQKVVAARPLAQLEGERLDEIVVEQCYLIEGLVWAFALTTLPYILEQARVVEVEREELLVLGCTCGLGSEVGTLEEHEARDCQGVGFQSRPDFITEYRARPGVFAYWELKGGAYADSPENWETKVQFSAGALGWQGRTGQVVSEAWVVQLLKGRREGAEYDYQTKSKTGPLIQNSGLCYWYRREGNPPLDQADWQEQYEWQDAEGKNRRLGNNYRKTGLWKLVEDMPEVAQAGLSIPEFCAKFIPLERLGRHVQLLGPLQIHQVIASEWLEELVAHEQWWQTVCWELYHVLQDDAGGDWTHASYQAALRRLVPRSWACRRYGRRYACQFEDLCFSREGWQDPLGSGNYVLRVPHHEPEKQQVVARGIELPEGLSDEEEA